MNSFFLVCEWVGTAAFAVSGAMVAVDKGMDLFGVIFLAMVTALGGGTLRDVLIGHFPPRMFTNYQFLLLAVFCVFFLRAAWRVMFRHALRLWLRLAPVVTGYVMICELVDCFTLLSTGSAMLEFGCLFAGLTIAIDRYARGKMKLPEEPVPAQAQELPAEAPSAEAPAEVQP